jgi:hypothetical protein
MEGADQVLAEAMIDTRLAADGGVDLRQQGGGHLHHRHPAQQGRGREAGEIADHAAAHRHDRRAPLEAGVQQAVVHALERGERLVLLTVR